jgi:type I restriction enzyme S subunit
MTGRWREVRLGDVATVVRGVTYKKEQATTHPQDGTLPLLRATNFESSIDLDGQLVYVPETVVKPEQRMRLGDLLVATSSGSISVVGKSARLTTDWEGTFGAFCAVIRVGHEIDSRYLDLCIKTEGVRRRWSAAARGTNINNLKRSDLESTPVPLPPLTEQERIVELLEDHLSRLDAAERSIADARKRLEAIGLAHLTHARSHLAGSEIRRIAEFADTSLGKMLDSKKQVGVLTPYLRNINVRWGAFDLSDLQATPLTDADRLRLELRDGDVLACEGGEPGRNAVWRRNDSGVAFQKALHRLRVHDPGSVSPEYLSLMLTEAIRSGRCDTLFTGTTIKHLPQEKLRAIEIPLPDVATQQRLVAEHRAFSESVLRMEAEVQRGGLRMNQLRRSLLTMAFSGRMTTPPGGVVSATEKGIH